MVRSDEGSIPRQVEAFFACLKLKLMARDAFRIFLFLNAHGVREIVCRIVSQVWQLSLKILHQQHQNGTHILF
jgi:hypothetical protein